MNFNIPASIFSKGQSHFMAKVTVSEQQQQQQQQQQPLFMCQI